MILFQFLETLTFNSIMNSKRSFNALKLNITTKMTNIYWFRLSEIFDANCFETLTIYNSDPRKETHIELMKTLMKLSENSLIELNLYNVNLEFIQPLFHRQTSIKLLSVTGALSDSTFINNLKLTKLTLVGPKTKNLAEIIKLQPNLTTLKITTDKETEYDEKVFEEIVKLNKLESLDVPFLRRFNAEKIMELRQLRHLKKLSVSCNDDCLQNLIFTSLPSLQELDVNLEEINTPPNFVEHLAQNMPNIKSIKFRGALVTSFLNKFPLFYPNLESLWLINVESFFVSILNLQLADMVNFKLKHLFIVNHDRKVVLCTNDLIRFIKMFPKIETLVMTKFIEIQLNDFEIILRNLPDLKEIVIDSKSIESTIKVMSLIGQHGKSLKYVKLKNFKHPSNKESLQVFFDGKFSVIEKVEGNLILRQNKKSFLSRIMD